MIRTIGQELESSKAAGAKQRMDVYFGRIQALSKSPKLESRVRFGLTVRIDSQNQEGSGVAFASPALRHIPCCWLSSGAKC